MSSCSSRVFTQHPPHTLVVFGADADTQMYTVAWGFHCQERASISADFEDWLFHLCFGLLTSAKCTAGFHDCMFLSLKRILFVFKCIHFTVVTLLLTLKKEIEGRMDNSTESPFMY